MLIRGRRTGRAFRIALVAGGLLCAASDPSTARALPPASARPGDTTARPPAETGPSPAREGGPTSAGLPDLDNLKIPPGAILVICKEVKDALQLLPDGVLLSPDRYRALLDRLDQLERQVNAVAAEVPSACKLSGQVDGKMARLQAQFDFRTDRPRAVVSLGCQRAWLKPGATIDGHLPLLLTGEDGAVKVQIDTPGVHQVTLELEIPVLPRGPKGAEQGFDFGLPGAAITTLDHLALPPRVPEIRINGRLFATAPQDGQKSRVEPGPLGPADRLEVVWKGPAVTPSKEAPFLDAVGRIAVHLNEALVVTDVELSLQARGGEVREWRIQMPREVVPEIKQPRAEDDRIEALVPPDPRNPVLTIKLRNPSAEALRVVFQVRQARTKEATPVGPFAVLNATRQRGTITISAPADLRLRYQPRADVLRREVTDESPSNAVAEFTYSSLPPPSSPAAPMPPLVGILAEEVKGAVEARVEHLLQLTERGWRAKTTIRVTPVRTRVDHLLLDVPGGFQLDTGVGATPTDLVDRVEPVDGSSRSGPLRIKLVKEQTQPFSVTLPGLYPLGDAPGKTSLYLPRPLETLDRGGQIVVTLPEGWELIDSESNLAEPESGQRVSGAAGLPPTWRSEQFPKRVDLSWRPHRPEWPVRAVVDVTVGGGRILVRHQMWFPPPPRTPKRVALDVPAAVAEHLAVCRGGTLEPDRTVRLNPMSGNECSLEVSYRFALSDQEAGAGAPAAKPTDGAAEVFRRVVLPLVRLPGASRIETKVRVWTDPGLIPSLAAGAWEEQPNEPVPDRDILPALVLRSTRETGAVSLTLHGDSAADPAPVLVERALIQVAIAEGGGQAYRARFLVSHFGGRHVDVEFPQPLPRVAPELTLGGKKVARSQALPSPEGTGTGLMRMEVEPDLYRQPLTLEVRYRLAPHASAGGRAGIMALQPPRLRGAAFLGRVWWQVELPPARLGIARGVAGSAEQRWQWQAGLVAPRPSAIALEFPGDPSGSPPSAGTTRPGEGEPALVYWQSEPAPVYLVYAPDQVWLLACSLALLAIGLGLSFAPLPHAARWLAVILLGLTAVLAGVWWPDAVPTVLYGCQPGALVLAAVLAVQWLRNRRYRRRVIFLPGFTRLKAGSSRSPGGDGRPRGEPSTVDAPAQGGNSGVRSPERLLATGEQKTEGLRT